MRDCVNGKDECNGCHSDTLLASDTHLIGNTKWFVLLLLMGSTIILLNGNQGFRRFRSAPSQKENEVKRVFLMHLAVYDVIMGVYLVLLVAMGTVMGSRGDYCTQHDWWRSSSQCISLGCLFSISIHGSLLCITVLSVIRAVHGFYTCTIRVAWLVCGGVGLVNILQAVLPILSHIRDAFR